MRRVTLAVAVTRYLRWRISRTSPGGFWSAVARGRMHAIVGAQLFAAVREPIPSEGPAKSGVNRFLTSLAAKKAGDGIHSEPDVDRRKTPNHWLEPKGRGKPHSERLTGSASLILAIVRILMIYAIS